MSDLVQLLSSQLKKEAISKISENIGIDEDKAAVGISSALPVLVKALSQNAQDESGAESLFKALENDHDGSILDDVPGFLDGFDLKDGASILKHVLGKKESTVENGLAKVSGIDKSQMAGILATLAPMVLGALSKKKQDSGLDIGGLMKLLSSEEEEVEKKDPDSMGILNKLLDADGDGDMTDDVVDIGAKLLKNFLS